jgi:hypothetical protein
MRVSRRQIVACPLLLCGLVPGQLNAQAQPSQRPLRFAFIGDTPYNPAEAALLRELLGQIDPQCRFLLHIGDIKARQEPWRTDFMTERINLLRQARQPLVLLPGDNEWSDAVPGPGQRRGFEWLGWLREQAYAKLPVPESRASWHQFRRQGSHPSARLPVENLMFQITADSPLFVTLNVPGGVALERLEPAEREHHLELEAMNVQWLDQAYHHAMQQGLKHLVIATHADPLFERDAPGQAAREDQYYRLRRTLERFADRYEGSILFLHGDTHRYRLDQPLRRADGSVVEQFTRLECYGSPFANAWIELTWSGVQWSVRTRSLPPEPLTPASR